MYHSVHDEKLILLAWAIRPNSSDQVTIYTAATELIFFSDYVVFQGEIAAGKREKLETGGIINMKLTNC